MALTPRKQKFVDARVAGASATDAAAAAGYSEKTARVQGPRLEKDPEVAAAITAGLKELAEEMKFDAKRILNELARVAFADIGAAFNEDGTLKALKDIPIEVRKTISGIDTEEIPASKGGGYTKKLRFWDKVRSLELLGKNLKLFTEKHEVEHKGTIRLFDPYAEPKK